MARRAPVRSCYAEPVFDAGRLLKAAAAAPEVSLAVVFGSAARNALRGDSDIDVAVLLAEDNRGVRERVEAALAAASDRPLDCVVLNDAPPQLRFEVAKGTLLFERTPGLWRAAKTTAMIDWWDWQETARSLHATYLSRLRAQVEGTRGP